MRMRAWIVGMVLTGLVASGASDAPQKKLIHFGWDMHSPAALAEKIGELQRLPFDGLTVRAMNFSTAFLFAAPFKIFTLCRCKGLVALGLPHFINPGAMIPKDTTHEVREQFAPSRLVTVLTIR